MSEHNPQVFGYLEGLPPERREALEALRFLVREVAPDARETRKYRMPNYEIGAQCYLPSPRRNST